MNKLLFHLLHAIHRQKKQRTIAILIYALYKPILWRYLEVANGMVRLNINLFVVDDFFHINVIGSSKRTVLVL